MQSVDTGAACDAAALQNERSASIQSIHEESVLTDQVTYIMTLKLFLQKSLIKW